VYLVQGERYLTAVAVLHHLEPGALEACGGLRFSTFTHHDRQRPDDVELRSVALVTAANAASVALPNIEWLPVDVRHGRSTLFKLPRNEVPDLLRRAHDYDRERRARDPITICCRASSTCRRPMGGTGWRCDPMAR
jgi:hypothetical protein